jgi:hypothetical protein
VRLTGMLILHTFLSGWRTFVLVVISGLHHGVIQ